ncbi:fasciclin-like arabinogalactan protein 12 [Prosopis cineraria]|uniref:fasciclin-like arabinogalactan protein 12 n=1 Tax=Prosopis cineraria TaxID=364024 RepID=UPI002410AB71|nr:fasciclin-like arabinogalactan protein 12 [Prosopis cineraria]
MKQSPSFFSLALLISFLCSTTTTTTTLAQSPAAAPAKAATSPAAAAPAVPQSPSVDIVGILTQANGYTVFIRLLKSTQLVNQISSQLATAKSGGITILAPDDGAFSELKPGFLNTLSDRQKLELLQFHVLPDYISTSNFDTLTNPVRTLASANPSKAQLNVTSFGGNVNISTGVVNTTLNGVIYTDNHLNIYRVGKVLLPQDFFAAAKAPAPAPAKAKAKPKAQAPPKDIDEVSPVAKAPKPEKEKPSTDSTQSSQVVPTQVNSGAIRIRLCGTAVSTLGVAFAALLSI